MDAQDLLDQLFQAGKKLVEQGLDQGSELAGKGKELAQEGIQYAQETLRIPETGPDREKMLRHLGTGAAAGGILALMLGTQAGRRTLSRVATVGSLAALGVLGYKIYSDHQKQNGINVSDNAGTLNEKMTNSRCQMIVRSMIAAAKVDGRVDEQERQVIADRIRNAELDQSLIDNLLAEIQKPLSVGDVASMAKTEVDGVDIFLAALMVLDSPSAAEKQYLAELANSLELDPNLIKRLESDAFRPV